MTDAQVQKIVASAKGLWAKSFRNPVCALSGPDAWHVGCTDDHTAGTVSLCIFRLVRDASGVVLNTEYHPASGKTWKYGHIENIDARYAVKDLIDSKMRQIRLKLGVVQLYKEGK